MAKQVTECTRCCGKGEIPAHRNVLAGVCFKCGGTGKQLGTSKIMPKWAIFARQGLSAEHLRVFNLKAKSEASATAIAQETLKNGNGGWVLDSVIAEPFATAGQQPVNVPNHKALNL